MTAVGDDMAWVLGLDVGTRTIGISKLESGLGLTVPLCTLRRQSVREDSRRLAALCHQESIAQLVVGLPLELDGSEGGSARRARQVGDELARLTSLPLAYQDERFSTVDAELRCKDAGMSLRKQKQVIDQIAAIIILEDWHSEQSDD